MNLGPMSQVTNHNIPLLLLIENPYWNPQLCVSLVRRSKVRLLDVIHIRLISSLLQCNKSYQYQ